jgi:NAD(P)-dependent dehydrogenase (short-subunit alcohol dehydrogenase family)
MYHVSDQSGRRFVVTGANSGTGKEAAKRIAAAGGHVIMAVRNPDKGAAARAEILAEVPDAALEVRRLDLADLRSVEEFADDLLGEAAPLHVLVNNAGVMTPPQRFTTADGFELQFGTNFLGPFALTNRLLPLLLSSDAPRVATMASGAANFGRIHFRDLQFARRYQSAPAYAQSKLADLLMGVQLATIATERGWDLLSAMAHPGYSRTNLQTTGPGMGTRKAALAVRAAMTLVPSQGADQGTEPLLYAATDAGAEQGAYYGPRHAGLVGPTKKVELPCSARGGDLAASLWTVAERLTGTSLPAVPPSR